MRLRLPHRCPWCLAPLRGRVILDVLRPNPLCTERQYRCPECRREWWTAEEIIGPVDPDHAARAQRQANADERKMRNGGQPAAPTVNDL